MCPDALAEPATDTGLPRLRKQGTATQLIVDGQPFVMLAGELHNPSASGVEYLKTLWPKLRELGLNTVLAPVSWELIEPREGSFDFTLVDALLEQSRTHQHRLVLLWFGSWKNGVSSYAPRWVLQDTKRFPRALGSAGRNTKDILTPLSEANRKAEASAFARLMRHLEQARAQQARADELPNKFKELEAARDKKAAELNKTPDKLGLKEELARLEGEIKTVCPGPDQPVLHRDQVA
jgi:beta-galactosidase GanA